MTRARHCRAAVVAVAWATAGTVLGQDAQGAAEAEQRRQLGEQRRAIEARHAASQPECARRFAVSGCMEHARDERRRALIEIDAQEAALDDAERQRRAAERQERISAKIERRAAEQRERAASAGEVPAGNVAPLPVRQRRETASAASSPAPHAPRAAPDAEARKAQEARARAAAAERDEQRAARRKAAADREAERQRKGKPRAADLPPVGSPPMELPPGRPASAP